MLIGLTYDLKDDYLKMGYSDEECAEFDSLETIDGIDNALKSLGYKTERVGNIFSLISRLAKGEKWDLVFNIAEGMFGISREAQIPSILEAYRIPCTFSDPSVLTTCLHKGLTKKILKPENIKTADFYELERIEDIGNIDLPYPLFAKPIAEGTGKGISALSKIENPEELKKVCSELLNKFKQPVLVETFLSGREYTFGIIGCGGEAKVIGGMEVIYKENTDKIYSFSNKKYYEKFIEYIPVDDKKVYKKCEELCLRSWKILNCLDAGRVDIRFDDNDEPNFIEVNPLPGLNLIHSDLPILSRMYGIEYNELIGKIVASACKRYGLK